jgi:hypothetical protein
MPDGMETQYMCRREFPFFPLFQRFPQYYGFRSNIFDFRNCIFGFRNNMSGFWNTRNVSRCSSTRRVQYHCIWGTTQSQVHSCQLSRSCELQGVFGGVLCRAWSVEGDLMPGRGSSCGSPAPWSFSIIVMIRNMILLMMIINNAY